MWRNLNAYIESIYRRDPAARSALEILTTYPGVHALALHRVSHRLWGWRLKWLARVLSQLSRWLTGIEIHPGARIGKQLFIDHGMGVVIGETAEIGEGCTLYHGVTLGGTTWKQGKRHPTLEDNVVVGAGAKILGPITVGSGARVGSNSVVVRDVPAGATVTGIPGHIVTPERVAIAKKIGFDAYGQSADVADPVAHVIDEMINHMQLMDHKMKVLSEVLQKAGITADLELPQINVPALDLGDKKGATP